MNDSRQFVKQMAEDDINTFSYYWVYLHQTWGFCKTWSTLYDYVDQ